MLHFCGGSCQNITSLRHPAVFLPSLPLLPAELSSCSQMVHGRFVSSGHACEDYFPHDICITWLWTARTRSRCRPIPCWLLEPLQPCDHPTATRPSEQHFLDSASYRLYRSHASMMSRVSSPNQSLPYALRVALSGLSNIMLLHSPESKPDLPTLWLPYCVQVPGDWEPE